MKARTALFGYCLLAVLALIVWMVMLTGQIKSVQSDTASAQDQLDVSSMAVTLGEQRLKELSKEQRESRLEATAEDAIQLSADIQQLQESLDQARNARA